MIIISIIVWPFVKLTETIRIHQILCFVIVMVLIQFVAGQWKIASQSCLNAHNQLSKEITFMANCPKDKGVADTDDPKDEKKHQCLIMRRHCVKKCKGTDNTCPATSLFTLNLKVNKDTKAFESVECVCSYSTYISSCTGEYTNTWSDVENEFNEKCAATDKTTTSTTTSTSTTTTTVAKADCSELVVTRGGVNNLNPLNSNNRHNHGNKVTVTCNDDFVCPVSLPFDCIQRKETFTCNNGVWEDFEPTQCVQSLEERCRMISGKVLFDLCIKFDGSIIRDVAKERECNKTTAGRLMTHKNEAQLEQIFAEAFRWRDIEKDEPDKTYHLFVQLNQNLKQGQILRFQGVTPNISKKDITPENFQMYSGSINLEGRTVADKYPQHVPLKIYIDYKWDFIQFKRRYQGPDGQAIGNENEWMEEIKPIPSGLKPNENFDITIENTDNEFVIKFGDTEKHYPYVNRSLHHVNIISFFGRGFKFGSATLDGRHLRNGEQDKIYSDCFLVGLTNKNPSSDNPKVGWVWEDGEEAKPDETPWDIDAGEPNNKNGDERYACLSKKTKKLSDISSIAKRWGVCEYEDQTKTGNTKKRKKREVGFQAEQETVKPAKYLNLEL